MQIIINKFAKEPYIFKCKNKDCNSIFSCNTNELIDATSQENSYCGLTIYDSIITYDLACPCCGASYRYSICEAYSEEDTK
jgi:hypothetical protein